MEFNSVCVYWYIVLQLYFTLLDHLLYAEFEYYAEAYEVTIYYIVAIYDIRNVCFNFKEDLMESIFINYFDEIYYSYEDFLFDHIYTGYEDNSIYFGIAM